MELRDYIEMGKSKTDTNRKLAEYLGIGANELTDAKAHRRGLPNHAVSKLARLINVTTDEVLAASELATEKREDRREYWRPFVEHAKAASIALTFGLVTSFVTPPPAEAAPLLQSATQALCIMLSLLLIQHSEQRQLPRAVHGLFKDIKEALQAIFSPRITQIQGI